MPIILPPTQTTNGVEEWIYTRLKEGVTAATNLIGSTDAPRIFKDLAPQGTHYPYIVINARGIVPIQTLGQRVVGMIEDFVVSVEGDGAPDPVNPNKPYSFNMLQPLVQGVITDLHGKSGIYEFPDHSRVYILSCRVVPSPRRQLRTVVGDTYYVIPTQFHITAQ